MQLATLLLLHASGLEGQSCTLPSSSTGEPCTTVRVSVGLQSPTACLDVAQLPGCDGEPPGSLSLDQVQSPHHGQVDLVDGGSRIAYTPTEEFWSLGSDSHAYSYTCASQPQTLRTGLLQWVGRGFASETVFHGFQDPDLSTCGWNPIDPGTSLASVPIPADGSNHWLRVVRSADQPAYLVLNAVPSGGRLEWPQQCGNSPRPGTIDDCFEMLISGSAPTSTPWQGEVTVFDLSFEAPPGGPQPQPVEIRLAREPAAPAKVRARTTDDLGAKCTTPWTELGSHNSTLRLDLWRDGGSGAGIALSVDGRTAGIARCAPAQIQDLERVRVGLVELPLATGPGLEIDNLQIGRRLSDLAPLSASWLIETFECSLAESWQEHGSVPPLPSAAAALSGSTGLEIDLAAIAVSDPAYGFLHQAAPDANSAFNARFRLEPHSAQLVNGSAFTLLGASTRNAPHGGEHLRLKVRGLGGVLEARIEAKEDDHAGGLGGWQSSPWTTLDTGMQIIEVQWKAATEGIGNGWARLWIDGQLEGQLLGLDNDTKAVDSYRLGGIWVPPTASGRLYLDDLEVWE